MAAWISLGPLADVPDGLSGRVVGGQWVAIGRSGAFVAVFEDQCTHEECPLSDGYLHQGEVECMCHGARFDLRTGAVLQGPATEPIRVFAARVVEGELQAELPDA
jgi:nitrite reductase/ring-hydroxylating ferredoxin subunit